MAVRMPPVHCGVQRELCGDFAEGERAEVGEQQKQADQEAEVANAVDDEGLLAGVGCGCLLELEADQQVRREAHAFPTDKHQQGIAGEHEHRHEEQEEVQVG